MYDCRNCFFCLSTESSVFAFCLRTIAWLLVYHLKQNVWRSEQRYFFAVVVLTVYHIKSIFTPNTRATTIIKHSGKCVRVFVWRCLYNFVEFLDVFRCVFIRKFLFCLIASLDTHLHLSKTIGKIAYWLQNRK